MPVDQDLIWLDEALENQVFVLHPWLHPAQNGTNARQCQMVPKKITLQSHSRGRLDVKPFRKVVLSALTMLADTVRL